jgi:altronate dehydratase
MASKSATKSGASAKHDNLSFHGWRRENGRVGVRNHVVILPLDDLSNTVCEAVANNIKGTLAIPHAYGRLQFGKDLDLHFRTLIGAGSNPNVAAVVVVGIEDGWTKRVVDGIAKTGKPVIGFGIEGYGDIATIAKASYKAKEFVQWASELKREECGIADLWVSTKCGESDTTTGLSSCPAVGNMYDKLIPKGIYGVFGETSEITGAEHICRERAIDKAVADKWYKISGRCNRSAQGRRSIRKPADQRQHRWRPIEHRGEGARQPRKDRPRMPLHRCSRCCRSSGKRRRALLHGYVLGGCRMRHLDGSRWLGRTHLPDRAGQRNR